MVRYKTYSYTDREKLLLDTLINNKELVNDMSKDPRFSISPSTVIRLLFNRNIRDLDSIRYTLFGDIKNLYNVPFKGQSQFDLRLEQAYDNKELIVVMGDYDTDGTMATALLVKSLSIMEFNVEYHMNSRFVEGYGLKVSTVNVIKELYPHVRVIITVDNGIRSYEAIDYCNNLGIDVLVTDHHEPGEVLPNAFSIVDPKQDGCLYPFKGLCGAGVAWKLMYSYVRKHFSFDVVKKIDDLVWIAGIATVGDSVPLIMENRIIVKKSFEYINGSHGHIAFIESLKEILNITSVDVETIGYYISPMINAVGRIEGNPIQIVEAILSSDSSVVNEVVNHMDEVNKVRREITDNQLSKALSLVGGDPQKFIVVYDSSFSEGIVGIISSRLSEKFHRPSIVLCNSESGEVKGSARGIEGFSVIDSLDSISDLLVSYGGHMAAAGLSTLVENVNDISSRLNAYCDSLDQSIFNKVIKIDISITQQMVIPELCELLDNLGPYGKEFERPVVMIKNFEVDKERSCKNKSGSFYVGSDGNTLRLVDSNGLVSIGFKSSNKYKELGEPEVVHLVGYPSINEFNGYRNAQFLIDSGCIIKSK